MKTQSQNIKELILHLLKELLYNSVAQSILRIFDRKKCKPIKIFIFFSVLLSSCLSSFLIIQSIMSYFSYPVTTTTRNVSQNKILFPKITICNWHQFTTEFALDFLKQINKDLSPKLNIFDSNDSSEWSSAKFEDKLKLFDSIRYAGIARMMSKNFSDADKQRLAHSLDEILFKCTFNKKTCYSSDFVRVFNRLYGNCYVFNYDKFSALSLVRAGSTFGLKLDLYINYHENLTLFNSYDGGLGALIRVENNSYLTDFTLDGIRLTPGLETFVSIRPTVNYYLAKPYGDCDFDSNGQFQGFDPQLFNLITSSSYEYSQQLCIDQCLQQETIRVCNCSHTRYLSLFTQAENCETDTCTNKIFDEYWLSSKFIMDKCLPVCPLECKKSKFKIQTSSIKLTGYKYVDLIRDRRNLSKDFVVKKLNTETVGESILKVNLFYDSLDYTVSTESPKMSVVDLLSSIGGNLSLFLGVNVFSICEMVEVFLEIFIIFKNKMEFK